jgi:tetratricopeptide (TPR) repeat protein
MELKKFTALIISAGLIVTGCSMLPSPGSTIKAPRVASAQVEEKEDAAAIAQNFLPAGAKFFPPSNPDKVGAVREKDLDGDLQDEIVATYKVGDNASDVGAMVLKKKEGKWQKVWEQKGFGYDLDLMDFADITGDARPEVLIGGTIGASAGNGLGIFQWQEGTLKELASTGYHKLEILQPGKITGEYGPDDRALLAVWQKDTGTAMMVNVLRWVGVGFISAEDMYKAYFPKVVDYYLQQLKQMPNAPFLWYYLADAQQKVGRPEDAIKSIETGLEKGLAIQSEYYPPAYQFEMVRAKALNDLGEYEKAIGVFNNILKAQARIPKPGEGNQPEEPAFLKKVRAQAYLNLGRSYEGLKQYDKARENYQKSKDISISLYKEGTDDQILAMMPADKALRRLKGIKGFEKLSVYLSSLSPEERWQKLNELEKWGSEQNIAVKSLQAEDQDGGFPQTVLVDFSTDSKFVGGYADGHAIFWWDKDKFHSQVFYSADEDAHGFSPSFMVINARLSPGSDNTVEMGVVYDAASGGSGSPVPAYKVLRFEDDGRWWIVWSSPRSGWYNSHGKLTFAGHGISEVILEGDSWYCGDGRDNIFHESNAGPHRHFQSTWERQGDGYVLKEKKTIPTAYNTLVEFIYALSTGDGEAEKWVTDKALVEKAKQMKLVQNPLGQNWMLDFKDPVAERQGPLKIIKDMSDPEKGVMINFIEKNGQYLISDIK